MDKQILTDLRGYCHCDVVPGVKCPPCRAADEIAGLRRLLDSSLSVIRFGKKFVDTYALTRGIESALGLKPCEAPACERRSHSAEEGRS